MKWFIYSFFIAGLMACTPTPSERSTKGSLTEASDGDGKNVAGGGGDIDNGGGSLTKRIELRHLVDPFDGSYKTKLSLPKNFEGLLYISGLNITALNDELIYVRFNFGREREPVTLPALVGTGPGITGTTNISVLILDVQREHFLDTEFREINLLYDLFDYYDYDPGEEAITDNRHPKMYCRGLYLEDDPTFIDSDGECDASGDKCLYAYAKVRDRGLVDASNISTIPSEPNIGLSGNYDSDSALNKLSKCLPANGIFNYDDGGALAHELNTSGALTSSAATLGQAVHTYNNTDYTFEGPFLPINTTNWQITTTAAVHDHVSLGVSPRGIFMSELTGGTISTGIHSYLFPRGGKLSLSSGTQYLGAEATVAGGLDFEDYSVSATRALTTLPSNTETNHMDGCNLRVTTRDSYNNESISSCNVTSTIEILTIDPQTGEEVVKASTRDIKLQLVKASSIDNEGQETLYTAMQTCSSSTSCPYDFCCFNNRCVSTSIVSQCFEDALQTGNNGVGEACTTDYECTSLCCDQSLGRCSVHDNILDPPVLCQKQPGASCVANEWCRQDPIPQYTVQVTETLPDGTKKCRIRSSIELTHGTCQGGTCVAPTAPPVPTPFADDICPDDVVDGQSL